MAGAGALGGGVDVSALGRVSARAVRSSVTGRRDEAAARRVSEGADTRAGRGAASRRGAMVAGASTGGGAGSGAITPSDSLTGWPAAPVVVAGAVDSGAVTAMSAGGAV
jgi:hypothetical protein